MRKLAQETRELRRAPETGIQSQTQQVIPLSVIRGTRRYLEVITQQINGSYESGLYDACAVMMRKLIESLIIEVFEGCGLAERIKTGAGDFLPLDGLIGKIIGEPSWNLSRETRRALPAVKQVGDNSAHGRRFHAHRGDIDNLRTGFRAAVQELITLGRWSDPT